MRRFRQAIDENVRGILYILLYPPSVKVARINVCAWFFALIFALTSIGLFLFDENFQSPWMWSNVLLAFIDAYLLHRSWSGYRRVKGESGRSRSDVGQ